MAIRQATTPQHDAGITLERKEQALRPPAMYEMLPPNDDCTPMEFIAMVLQQYFSKDRETATQIMLMVHREDKSVCGLCTRDIAAMEMESVSTHVRQAGHPLQCMMEET